MPSSTLTTVCLSGVERPGFGRQQLAEDRLVQLSDGHRGEGAGGGGGGGGGEEERLCLCLCAL